MYMLSLLSTAGARSIARRHPDPCDVHASGSVDRYRHTSALKPAYRPRCMLAHATMHVAVTDFDLQCARTPPCIWPAAAALSHPRPGAHEGFECNAPSYDHQRSSHHPARWAPETAPAPASASKSIAERALLLLVLHLPLLLLRPIITG